MTVEELFNMILKEMDALTIKNTMNLLKLL